MNAKKINTLFKHPEQITSEDLIGLKQAVDDFPYAAPLHALYMKALQKKESYLLPGQIKRAAIATPNRAALKEFHDMPIPGMESTREVPVVDLTEVAETEEIQMVEVALEQEAQAVMQGEELNQENSESIEDDQVEREPTPTFSLRKSKSGKDPESIFSLKKSKSEVENSESFEDDQVEREPTPTFSLRKSKSGKDPESIFSLKKSKPEVDKAVEDEQPKEIRSTSLTDDLSHLPEAVRNAILRSRALRGHNTPESTSPEKKVAQPMEAIEEPKPVRRPAEVIVEGTNKIEEKPVDSKQKDSNTTVSEKQQPKSEEPPVQEKLELREMPFSEKASFMEWLVADFSDGEPKKVKRSSTKDVKTIISELPKFPVPKKDGKIDVFHLPSNDQGKFVTETLAEIYLNQGLWDKAINAYEILSLKYPEKSGFFADRIKEIKKHNK